MRLERIKSNRSLIGNIILKIRSQQFQLLSSNFKKSHKRLWQEALEEKIRDAPKLSRLPLCQSFGNELNYSHLPNIPNFDPEEIGVFCLTKCFIDALHGLYFAPVPIL